MSFKERLVFMFLLMCVITTGFVAMYAIMFLILYHTAGTRQTYPIMYHYKYILVAFLCTLPTLVFIKSENSSKIGYRIRIGINFTLTISTAFFGTLHFFWGGITHWESFIRGFFVTVFTPLFSVLYFTALFVYHRRQTYLSNIINEKIRLMNELEEERNKNKN